MKIVLLALVSLLAVQSYKIFENPDVGDFTAFPVADLGNSAFPTTLAFSPDGRIFVGRKNGIVNIISKEGKVLPEPWIDLSDRVNSAGDKGLTSLILDPQFPSVPYVYMTYPLWQNDSHDLNRVTQGIVARYTEIGSSNVATASGQVSSEFVLIGAVNGTGFPSCHNSHNTGDLVFGNDGTLFASAGEGSHWDAVDDGEDFNFDPYDWQCAPFFGPEFDVGSFRAQLKGSLGGKVIRMDSKTGNGIGSDNFPSLVPNPFYDQTKPHSAQSLIWTFGHRNPWKLLVRPGSPAGGPGTLYVAEVGAKDYEELNVIKTSQAGSNYGWPCQIANGREQPWFTNTSVPTEYFVPRYPTNLNTIDKCKALQPNLTNTVSPIFYYSRSLYVFGEQIGIIGNCASGMSFYNGSTYPAAYRPQADGSRSLFISDFGNQWIKVIRVDSDDHLIQSTGVQAFLEDVGTILHMAASPSGDIYYLTEEGVIYRIEYTAAYVGPPIVAISATPQFTNIAKRAATIQFSSDGSFDPVGNNFTFAWSFGDGASSSLPNPSHTYTTAGKFNVQLVVTNSLQYSSSANTVVYTNNDAPVATIAGPQWFSFVMNQNIDLNVTLSDDSTSSNDLQWQWEYRIVHNNHYHPNVLNQPSDTSYGTGSPNTQSATFSGLISQYERNMLEIYVTVVDGSGASSRTRVRAVPDYPGNSNYGTNNAPVANFTSAQQGSAIFADGSVTVDLDIDYLSYTWNWGDGTTGSGRTIYHTYAQPGTYTVTMTAEDPWAAQSTTQKSVTVVSLASPSPSSPTQPQLTSNNNNNSKSNASTIAAGFILILALIF